MAIFCNHAPKTMAIDRKNGLLGDWQPRAATISRIYSWQKTRFPPLRQPHLATTETRLSMPLQAKIVIFCAISQSIHIYINQHCHLFTFFVDHDGICIDLKEILFMNPLLFNPENYGNRLLS